VFAQLNAGHVGGDGFEGAAHLGGGGGLHVPQVDLARAAEEEEEDAGVAAALVSRGVLGGQGAQSRQVG